MPAVGAGYDSGGLFDSLGAYDELRRASRGGSSASSAPPHRHVGRGRPREPPRASSVSSIIYTMVPQIGDLVPDIGFGGRKGRVVTQGRRAGVHPVPPYADEPTVDAPHLVVKKLYGDRGDKWAKGAPKIGAPPLTFRQDLTATQRSSVESYYEAHAQRAKAMSRNQIGHGNVLAPGYVPSWVK